MPALYDRAHIFLNGSRVDNQPLSILEAFASGLPVVTTNAGGIPDMVTNGRTGIIVNIDDYRALARSAIQLLEEPALADEIADRALNECQKYTWAAVRNDWLAAYKRGKEIVPQVQGDHEQTDVTTC
jgi:glycosyltransferase involved in cell wall biosynthesis